MSGGPDSSTSAPLPADAGLQAERTAMAWQRTALAVGGTSALLLQSAAGPVSSAPGVLGLAVAVLLLGQSGLRYLRTARRAADGRAPSDPRLLTVVALLAVSLAAVATALVATGAFPDPGRA